VNAVNWSPSGNYCFISTHDSILTIIDNVNNTNSSVNLTHSPVSHIITVSDSQVYVVGFDRHLYLYENYGDKWAFKKCLTKETPLLDQGRSSSVVTESVGGGIAERLKQFGGGAAVKKTSIVVTSQVQKNIHSANINSVCLINNKYIATTDYAGFVKFWNI
jgi:hypothetical protein